MLMLPFLLIMLWKDAKLKTLELESEVPSGREEISLSRLKHREGFASASQEQV